MRPTNIVYNSGEAKCENVDIPGRVNYIEDGNSYQQEVVGQAKGSLPVFLPKAFHIDVIRGLKWQVVREYLRSEALY